jgi:hypothetical protein
MFSLGPEPNFPHVNFPPTYPNKPGRCLLAATNNDKLRITTTTTTTAATTMDTSVILSCVTTAEDKVLDYEAYSDIRYNRLASSDSKTSNTLKLLDIFLAAYCRKIKAPYTGSRDLTYYGIKTTGTFKSGNSWWDDMIGSFFSYLYKDAYKYGDPDKGKVSYETATGYALSVKSLLHHQVSKRGA